MNRPHVPASARAGFSLIELIVVIAILTVLAGTTLPTVGRTLTRSRIADTRAELSAMPPALTAYFEDTDSFPPVFGDLEQNLSGAAGWAGPYLRALLAGQPSTTTSLSKDAWNRDYVVSLSGVSELTLTSLGPDGVLGSADDLVQVVDVTPVRRARSVAELKTVNTAITAWNAVNLPATPLSTSYPTLLSTLAANGYLPAGTTAFDTDGWGDPYDADPPGVSPVVAVNSSHL
jgi:general secretion pathway protein G